MEGDEVGCTTRGEASGDDLKRPRGCMGRCGGEELAAKRAVFQAWQSRPVFTPLHSRPCALQRQRGMTVQLKKWSSPPERERPA